MENLLKTKYPRSKYICIHYYLFLSINKIISYLCIKKKEMKKSTEELKAFIEETVKDNIPQGRAIKAIFTSREHLFITGVAGSGKSTFINNIKDFLDSYAIVAPTGIAAINAGGVTMHSFFRLPISPYIPKIKNGKMIRNCDASGDPNFKKRLNKLDTLIIDEISMVRADVLDRVSDVLMQTRKKKVPFGGVRLIMFGDLNQLPPIVTGSEGRVFEEYYDSPYFFSSKAMRLSGFTTIEFNKVYRQKDDVFIGLLNSIRRGVVTEHDQELLDSRFIPVPKDFDGIRLCSHNNQVQEINERMLSKLPGEEFEFSSHISGAPPKNVPCEDLLKIKVGCQVIMGKNSPGYYNGSSGIVERIDEDNEIINVRILRTGKTEEITREIWENKEYSIVNGRLCEVTIGSVSQFPMKLGYALSSHRAQGMTFDKVLIDVNRAFTNGQVYVALSRCRTLEGTYLSSPITQKQLIQDHRLLDFYKRSEENGGVFAPETLENDNQDKVINFADYGL